MQIGANSKAAEPLDFVRETHGVKISHDPRLWAIVAVALALGFATSLRYLHEATPRGQADDLHYHQLAKTLLERGQFGSTYRAPGYSTFVALLYSVTGPHPFAVYAVQSVMFALSLAFVASIFEQITRSRNIALLTAGVTALYPFCYTFMVLRVLTEGLASFLIALFLWILYSVLQRVAWWKAPALGVIFAAAALTKAVLLPFAGVLALCLFVVSGGGYRAARQAMLFLAFAALCIAPWTYRNWRVTGAFLPVSTGAGVAFWLGNYPGNFDARVFAPERGEDFPHLPPDLETAVKGMSEVQRDDCLKRAALDWMCKNPGQAFLLFCHKFSALWLGNLGVNRGQNLRDWKPLFSIGDFMVPKRSLLTVPVFILGMIGLRSLSRTQHQLALPVTLLLAWFTFIYVVLEGDLRYSIPVYPYMIGFASIALLTLVSRVFQPRSNARLASTHIRA
jgi:4-amino-4-deoxy-L-arabinose transferase-like glycosyltransferase